MSQKGLSLIELTLAVSIFTIMGITAWTFQRNIYSYNDNLQSSLFAEQEGRDAIKTITQEVHSASPSSIGAYPIDQAQATSFTFYSDINNDGLKEKVRYFLDGTDFKKGIIQPTGNPLSYNPAAEKITIIVHNIRNGATSLFDYYDTSYDGTSPPLALPINLLAVRLVRITLIIDKDPSQPPAPLIFTTQVSMRNLKDNL